MASSTPPLATGSSHEDASSHATSMQPCNESERSTYLPAARGTLSTSASGNLNRAVSLHEVKIAPGSLRSPCMHSQYMPKHTSTPRVKAKAKAKARKVREAPGWMARHAALQTMTAWHVDTDPTQVALHDSEELEVYKWCHHFALAQQHEDPSLLRAVEAITPAGFRASGELMKMLHANPTAPALWKAMRMNSPPWHTIVEAWNRAAAGVYTCSAVQCHTHPPTHLSLTVLAHLMQRLHNC